MLRRALPYRLSAALLASVLLLTGAVPVAMHLCEMAGHAEAMPACCSEHKSSGHEDGEHCPMQRPEGTDAPATAVCCSDAPAPATDRVAMTPPAASELDAAVAPLARWLLPPAVPAERPRPFDTGPPVPTLRPHLAFSVLLI